MPGAAFSGGLSCRKCLSETEGGKAYGEKKQYGCSPVAYQLEAHNPGGSTCRYIHPCRF